MKRANDPWFVSIRELALTALVSGMW
jgi:hypothetical protein